MDMCNVHVLFIIKKGLILAHLVGVYRIKKYIYVKKVHIFFYFVSIVKIDSSPFGYNSFSPVI